MNGHQPHPVDHASVYSMKGRVAGYDERVQIAVQIVENLPLLVATKRHRMGLSLRDLAQLTGVGYTTLFRFERGETVQASAEHALLRWIGGLPIPPTRDGQATDDS